MTESRNRNRHYFQQRERKSRQIWMNTPANNSEKNVKQQHHLAFHSHRTQTNHLRQAVTTEIKI